MSAEEKATYFEAVQVKSSLAIAVGLVSFVQVKSSLTIAVGLVSICTSEVLTHYSSGAGLHLYK